MDAEISVKLFSTPIFTVLTKNGAQLPRADFHADQTSLLGGISHPTECHVTTADATKFANLANAIFFPTYLQ